MWRPDSRTSDPLRCVDRRRTPGVATRPRGNAQIDGSPHRRTDRTRGPNVDRNGAGSRAYRRVVHLSMIVSRRAYCRILTPPLRHPGLSFCWRCQLMWTYGALSLLVCRPRLPVDLVAAAEEAKSNTKGLTGPLGRCRPPARWDRRTSLSWDGLPAGGYECGYLAALAARDSSPPYGTTARPPPPGLTPVRLPRQNGVSPGSDEALTWAFTPKTWWRWRESNPRPSASQQGFSERIR